MCGEEHELWNSYDLRIKRLLSTCQNTPCFSWLVASISSKKPVFNCRPAQGLWCTKIFWDFFVFEHLKIPLLVTHFMISVYHRHCTADLRNLERSFVKHTLLSIGKGEIHTGTDLEGTEGQQRCSSTAALTSALYVGGGGGGSTLRPNRFTSGK
jgi:hypothetical protein